MKRIPLLSLVALTDDLPGQKLTRGQIGTVVEHLDEGGEQALRVEFSDDQGKTYVMVDLKLEQPIVLYRKIEAA